MSTFRPHEGMPGTRHAVFGNTERIRLASRHIVNRAIAPTPVSEAGRHDLQRAPGFQHDDDAHAKAYELDALYANHAALFRPAITASRTAKPRSRKS
jgi:hypothetical protein